MNNCFEQKMVSHIINRASTIDLEDLRQLAILKHRIAASNLQKKLWTMYLKAGTGQWTTQVSEKSTVDRCFWTEQVRNITRSLVFTEKIIETTQQETTDEVTVRQYLEDFNRTIIQDQMALDKMKATLVDFTDEMEKILDTFVEQHGIRLLRLKLNYDIAMLEYDYDTQILERQYLELEPTEVQVCLRICISTM